MIGRGKTDSATDTKLTARQSVLHIVIYLVGLFLILAYESVMTYVPSLLPPNKYASRMHVDY